MHIMATMQAAAAGKLYDSINVARQAEASSITVTYTHKRRFQLVLHTFWGSKETETVEF